MQVHGCIQDKHDEHGVCYLHISQLFIDMAHLPLRIFIHIEVPQTKECVCGHKCNLLSCHEPGGAMNRAASLALRALPLTQCRAAV